MATDGKNGTVLCRRRGIQVGAMAGAAE